MVNEYILAGNRGKITSERFEDFLPPPKATPARKRIMDFMVLGPFVLETGGALETEYLYERHKVLDCDYLASSGGEASAAPYLGLKCKNDYYGPEYLSWEMGVNKWDCLRFDSGAYRACNDALYATEQRNCVYYAATYIDCAEEYRAILNYETSGSLVYLNGKLIDNQPYGRVKGIGDYGKQVAIRLQKGKNLLMFKIRTGYICDNIDFSMSNCALFPLVAEAGNLGVAYPMTTAAFVGQKDAPRQVFPAFVGAFGPVKNGELTLNCEKHSEKFSIPAMDEGECGVVRLSLPAGSEGKTVTAQVLLQEGENKGKGRFGADTVAWDGFEGTEHVYSDFHFDTTYHQEQRIYALGAFDIMRNIVDLLEKDERFKAIISEVDYLHPYYSLYPAHRDVLRRMFESGRAEADCFYNQPNEMTSSPEGLVRNLVYGQLYHRDVMGAITPVYGPGDVFGHPNQLSQICAKGGCIGIYWGKAILGTDCLFRHMSPDGTELLHVRGHTSRRDALKMGFTHCHNSSGLDPKATAYPRDGDSAWMKNTLSHAQFSVMSDFHKGVIEDDNSHERKTGRPLAERTSRDISLYHAGVSLTRTDFKQANRLGENLLISAEKFASLACLYGAEYPEKALDKAWRQLLCGQHHDSITGTNNEVSFADLMIEYREAAELAADTLNRYLAYLASGIKTKKSGTPVIVFNPHTWERKEPCVINLPAGKDPARFIVEDSQGRQTELQVFETAADSTRKAVFIPKVPALGYAVYYLKEKAAKKLPVEAEDRVIENGYYRLEVDPAKGGGIVGIYDKTAKREVLIKGEDGPGNRVVILREVPDRMETQHEFYTTGHKMVSSDFPAEVKSVKGENFTKLLIRVKMGTVAVIKQEITLFKGVKRIDMKTVVEDYQDKDDLFTLTFPLNIKGVRPVFDDRFAPAVRGESEQKLVFQTHQFAMFSRCQVYAANQWLDYGPTVTLSLKGKNSVNVGMTQIIRQKKDSLMNAADILLKALTKKAVPVACYPDTTREPRSCRLIHFNEDLFNTDTRFVLSVGKAKNEYEKKLLKSCPPAKLKAFEETLERDGIAVMYLKDSDNVWNKSIDVFLIKAAKIAKLNEFAEAFAARLEEGESFAFDSPVLAVRPGAADDYGVSVFNTGNLACSIENGGLMNLMLFHTAEFYGNSGKTTGEGELIPEQKSHVFTYALYPHEGSYRKAQVYRKALEFNDPLIAVSGVSQVKKPVLPEQKSFLKSNADFIVTAFKLKGYPAASMRGNLGDIQSRGLALRGFEPDGAKGKAELTFGFGLKGAQRVNLLEEEPEDIAHGKTSLKFLTLPHSIETFALSPVLPEQQLGHSVLGAMREEVEPTYVRSWEHDLGSMPMGYLAVAAVIDKKVEKIDELNFRVEINAVNNRPDMKAKGTLNLTLPKGWSSDFKKINYNIEPGGHGVYPVIITKPSADAKGLIRLNYKDDGQLFEDVFEVGSFMPTLDMEIDGNEIRVNVMNLTEETLSGELALATPIETWGLQSRNPFAFADISPRTQKVSVAPGERKAYSFSVNLLSDEVFPAYYAVAKLMINGRIYFAYARNKGPLHNYWAHVYARENGSIINLLTID